LRGQLSSVQSVFRWLCDYSDENGLCFPSYTRLAEDAGVTRRTAITAVKHLVRLGALEKTSRFAGKDHTSNLYQICIVEPGGGEMVAPPGEMVALGGGEKSVPGTKPTIINQNHLTTTPPKGGDEAAAFIDLFKEINPSYRVLFARKTQREAAQRLLAQHDLGYWSRFIGAYTAKLADRYCPKATTPLQLEEKLGVIIAYARQKPSGVNVGVV
jgi:hypothetical protein